MASRTRIGLFWKEFAPGMVFVAVALMPSAVLGDIITQSLMDGFGDGDRNNNGSITYYDTDLNLSGTFNQSPEDDALINAGITEITTPEDAGDTGFIWAATRGFTGANDGDPKANLNITDDSSGIGSGYALGVESKGTGSSFAGFFGDSILLNPKVGSKVVVKVDFRYWNNPVNLSAKPINGELRWGLFQDTDGQFGQTNAVGKDSGGGQANVVWGDDTGENDGLWRDANPGPVGDKGIWSRIPLGAGVVGDGARIVLEKNTGNYLEGSSVGCPDSCGAGDVDTVASPPGDGTGGVILLTSLDNTVEEAPHQLMMEIVRLSDRVEVATFVDGVEILRDDISPTDPDVVFFGGPPESFDYIAFRNATGDWDYLIDNVMIQSTMVPEPGSLVLLALGALLAWSARRRR